MDLELKRFEGEVQSTLFTYEAFSKYIFDEINQDEEIKEILYQASRVSEEEKNALRELLYEKTDQKYLNMQKHEFRQFHFHLPTTESFLRVHTPEKYGDLLLDVRESVRIVNERRVNVIGFEEGKIFNGFRFIYPLDYNDFHIGSVEISISSASIIEVLSKLYPEKDFRFIIEKAVVLDNVFEEEIVNYGESLVFKDYYIDKEVQ